MKLKYRPMAIMGFSSLFVLFICVYIDDRLSFAAIGSGLLILLFTVFFSRLRERITPFFVAAALIISGISFEIMTDYKKTYVDSLTDKQVKIVATILDEPEYRYSKYHYTVKTQSIDGKAFNTKMNLTVPKYIETEIFDEIEIEPYLYKIGSFSKEFELYYHSRGIFLGGFLNNYDETPVKIIKTDNRSVEYFLLKFRKTVENRILDKLPNDYGAVTVGMLTGNKDYISDDVMNSIKGAGVAPIFAVSGMHLSVWAVGLYSILELFRVRKRINSAVGIFFVLFFMGVTGFTPSVCRAGIMLIVLLAGNLFYRKSDPLNSLGLAVLILGLLNPMIVADIGFLLSLTSTLGIILLNPILLKYILTKLPSGIVGKILSLIIGLMTVPLFAMLGSIGVTVIFIGYISVYSIISNILISYAASFCMLAGGLTALFYPVAALSDYFALITGLLSKFIIFIITKISEWPFSSIDTSDVICGYCIIIIYTVIAVSFIAFRKKLALKISCVGVAVTVFICSTVQYFINLNSEYISLIESGGSINAVVSMGGHNAVILSSESDKYIVNNVKYVIGNKPKCKADIIIADISKSNIPLLNLLKSIDSDRLVTNSSDNSVSSVYRNITVSQNADIVLWNDTKIEFVSDEDYSVAICKMNNYTVSLVLRNGKVQDIPQKYLKCNLLVCHDVPQGADYENVLFLGDYDGVYKIDINQK